MSDRGTSNTNDRGSALQRRRRRAWVLATFDEDLGPDRARCALAISPKCEEIVTAETMQIDRIVPGRLGGRYTRDNIRPACAYCNHEAGTRLREEIHARECRGRCYRCQVTSEYRAAREAAELAREASCAGYATEEALYGPLTSFRDYIVARAAG